jgi:co-chaperonin GroES (HSP10)
MPFDDWCVVEPEVVRETEGGILIPAGADDDPDFMSKTGTVVATGPGMLLQTDGTRAEIQCRVGERVEYLANVAKRVKVKGKELAVVRDRNMIFRYVQ